MSLIVLDMLVALWMFFHNYFCLIPAYPADSKQDLRRKHAGNFRDFLPKPLIPHGFHAKNVFSRPPESLFMPQAPGKQMS
jgi:hypothetical protein